MTELNRVTVLGCGVLGGQIAWHNAFRGKQVVVYDLAEAALAACRQTHALYADIYRAELGAGDGDIDATWALLRYTTALDDAVGDADLVIEAVPEDPDIKAAVYRDMAPLLAPHTLLATNSSTLLPRDFAEYCGRPDKFCALHYANLIWRANLIEIMAHPGTAEATLTAVTGFVIDTGMVPIPVRKEQNGYILNTWLMALLMASQTLVTNEVATPEDVDRTYLIANRGSAVGPMGMIDIIGMKTVCDVLTHWAGVTGDAQMQANASYLKTRYLDRGLLGTQSGEGYYRYPDPAFMAPDFLAVPAHSEVADIVAKVRLAS
ncbi:3-hydroxyacyl-CoA dehydrogenase [Parahaliea mediterranea]|uniref:3-hydroxyacyl-CoA dehydrogenase n=1 Tax=Parahaliea mediterranea TaxID=651086 RepID=UPI000E2E84BA|nr:3-hydroxyacyl-CoA dehydrogenase [Parahaliea mediterranea]